MVLKGNKNLYQCKPDESGWDHCLELEQSKTQWSLLSLLYQEFPGSRNSEGH